MNYTKPTYKKTENIGYPAANTAVAIVILVAGVAITYA